LTPAQAGVFFLSNIGAGSPAPFFGRFKNGREPWSARRRNVELRAHIVQATHAGQSKSLGTSLKSTFEGMMSAYTNK
jgi:hypothetical protein